jgi:N-hydroxyarylamine O-acetyltransferase
MGVALEGKLWITDVGTNLEYARIPLLLETDTIQTDGLAEYRYSAHEFFGFLQEQRRPGEDDWQPQIGFTLEPQIDLDFVTPLFYYETHPGSNMSQFPRVSLYRPDGLTAIRDHTLLEERGGVVVSSRPIEDWQEEKELIRTLFRLDTDGLP